MVLASAIDTQSRIGMINNRVFEALSCGAIVVSDNYTALHALASEVLLLVDQGPEVAEYLHKVGRSRIDRIIRLPPLIDTNVIPSIHLS